MTPRKHASPPKPRVCAFCGSPLAEKRPVFLVHTPTGAIVGPYHAGCAEREVLKANEHGAASWRPQGEVVEYGKAAREETLPW